MFRTLMSLLLLGAPLAVFAQQSDVQVLRAEWGAGRTWTDVTQRLQAIVNARPAAFRVDTDSLGDDPLPGTPKTLRVRLRNASRQVQSFEYKDLETVQLREWGIASGRGGIRLPGMRSRQGRQAEELRILSAKYGDGRRESDVALLLNNAIQNNTLAIQATNQNLGGDPAPAVKKRLTVEYQWQGQTQTVTVAESEWLRLPDASAGAAAAPVAQAGLRIVEASWGEGSRQLDVTGRMQSLVQNDRLSLKASNETAGGDPARGASKRLTVTYDWRGRRYQTTVNEGRNLNVPLATDRIIGAAESVAPSDASNKHFDTADQVWKIHGDGVCFYRQTYFKGDAVCLRAGQELASLSPDGTTQFLSVRFFGNAQRAEVWTQPNFAGRSGRFTRDVTDLDRAAGGAFGFGGATKDIGSARVN
jgi:hypothetical protein